MQSSYTMIKTTSLSAEQPVLAQDSHHCYIGSPPRQRQAVQVAAYKSRLKPLPKSHLLPSGQKTSFSNLSHKTTHLHKSSFSFCLCKGRNNLHNLNASPCPQILLAK